LSGKLRSDRERRELIRALDFTGCRILRIVVLASINRRHLIGLVLAIEACARQTEGARQAFTPGEGHFVWTDSTSHDAIQSAYHTRCGSILHVWIQDSSRTPSTNRMVIAILGFQGRPHEVPAYPDVGGHPAVWAHAGLYGPGSDNTELAAVLGQLRFDQVTDEYVAGQLRGRLVWGTRWGQADTSGTMLLDFRAPRHRSMENYLCESPRM
jgi:hypothetical protein